MSKKPSKSLTIRNSTAEFLIFTNQAGENGIEVRYQDETVWLTQKLMAELFDTTKSTISEHLRNTQCDVRKGDVFFTPSSEIRGDIAHSAVAVEDIDKAVHSYHIVRFRLNEDWDTIFRAYAFKSSYFYKQAYRMCEGSGQRYVISQNDFRSMAICIPNLEKQRKIAQTLRTRQKEIDLLKQIAKQHRTQKRGLMQKLLTGEWRVRA